MRRSVLKQKWHEFFRAASLTAKGLNIKSLLLSGQKVCAPFSVTMSKTRVWHELLIMLQINYKLFNAARNKSAMNYQVGRFDMEMEPDVNLSCDRHKIMRSTVCPRHSHNERVRPSLPDTHVTNIAASTVSRMFLYHRYSFNFCVERIKIHIYFTIFF